jgi:hypothetical protein
MGGPVPLGYDLNERKLIVNPAEAKLVVRLFNLYLDLGCVSRLKATLDQEGIKSKEGDKDSLLKFFSVPTPYQGI